MYVNDHMKKWDELHQMYIFRPVYPTEAVVRFIKMNVPMPGARILDLGCGAGRHVVFLASEGYEATGIDFSKIGLDVAHERLAGAGLQAALVEGSILSLPFADETFDGVISYGVLIYFRREDLKTVIRELHRVLRKGGKAFIVVRSIHDKRYGQGEEVERNTFKMSNPNEEDLIVHYFDSHEIENELFSQFSQIQLGFTNEEINSLDPFNSNYLITLTK